MEKKILFFGGGVEWCILYSSAAAERNRSILYYMYWLCHIVTLTDYYIYCIVMGLGKLTDYYYYTTTVLLYIVL